MCHLVTGKPEILRGTAGQLKLLKAGALPRKGVRHPHLLEEFPIGNGGKDPFDLSSGTPDKLPGILSRRLEDRRGEKPSARRGVFGNRVGKIGEMPYQTIRPLGQDK